MDASGAQFWAVYKWHNQFDDATNMHMIQTGFEQRWGAAPSIQRVTLRKKTEAESPSSARLEPLSSADVVTAFKQNLRDVHAVPEPNIRPRDTAPSLNNLAEPESGAPTVRAAAQVFPTWAPSAWEADAYKINRSFNGGQVQLNVAAIDQYFLWDGGKGHYPWNIPADWAIELGLTLTEDSIQVVWPNRRPACAPYYNAPYRRFWSRTFREPPVDLQDNVTWYGGNVPESAAPYIDYELDSDGCEQNGLEFGIGYPRNLAVNTGYILFAEVLEGELTASKFSASVALKSNDCDPLFEPNTRCIGLNTGRPVPPPYDVNEQGSQPLVGLPRQWTVPGCFMMATGFTEPVRIPAGQQHPAGDCPPAQSMKSMRLSSMGFPPLTLAPSAPSLQHLASSLLQPLDNTRVTSATGATLNMNGCPGVPQPATQDDYVALMMGGAYRATTGSYVSSPSDPSCRPTAVMGYGP